MGSLQPYKDKNSTPNKARQRGQASPILLVH